VLTRERHATVAAGVDGGDISGQDRGHAGVIKGVGKGVGMSQLPAVRERTIGTTGRLIRIAAMPKRQGQMDKGADPDVLPIAQGGIAVLLGPIQRGGRFDMREGCTVITAIRLGRARVFPMRRCLCNLREPDLLALTGAGVPVRSASAMSSDAAPRGAPRPRACPPAVLHRPPGAADCHRSRRET